MTVGPTVLQTVSTLYTYTVKRYIKLVYTLYYKQLYSLTSLTALNFAQSMFGTHWPDFADGNIS